MIYEFEFKEQPPVLENHLNLGGKSPNGSEISLNSRYFKKNGKPYIPVMGEFHFSRYDCKKWRTELLKMKAGGIDVVSTYLFWIYHEEEEGIFDFEGDKNIREFVNECAQAGLDVVIRIGPWAHGECRNGGFPEWLLKKDFKLRDNNEYYMSYVKKWYSAIYNELKGLFFKDGGNIIFVQLENELTDNASHLFALKQMAIECGIVAPIYTVTGWNSVSGARIPEDEVVPVFGGYCEAPWEAHTNPLKPSVNFFFNPMRNDTAIGSDLIAVKPDEKPIPYERYPFATCEIGGGIQVTHHRRPYIKPMDIYALALVKLGSGNNLPGYYMYHGGTNKIGKLTTLNEDKASGYPNDYTILSYDFQAPIGECGQIRRHYRLLKNLHLFLHDFEDIFAPMDAYFSKENIDIYDTNSFRYSVRTDGECGFVFVNHYQRLTKLQDIYNVQFKIKDNFVFPDKGINICGETAFILPFGLKINGYTLEYATSQLICRDNNTYFFAEISGIEPEYKIDGKIFTEKIINLGDIKIVTLSAIEAEYIYKLDNKIFLGMDLYINNGEISLSSGKTYMEWNGEDFVTRSICKKSQRKKLSYYECDSIESEYRYELQIGTNRKEKWYRIKIDKYEGIVEFSYEGDCAQIYVDGKLVADDFYYGGKWQVSADILRGEKVELGISELKDDIYLEVKPKSSLKFYGAEQII